MVSGRRHELNATLIDFGIAKSTGAYQRLAPRTLVGVTVGSTGYMSPEQLDGSSGVDERSDLWSLAAVAYWCLTGRPPFEEPTFDATSFAVGRGHVRPVAELCPELPPDLDRWFDKALAPDVDERFQNATLMCRVFKVAAFNDPRHRVDMRERSPAGHAVRPSMTTVGT